MFFHDVMEIIVLGRKQEWTCFWALGGILVSFLCFVWRGFGVLLGLEISVIYYRWFIQGELDIGLM